MAIAAIALVACNTDKKEETKVEGTTADNVENQEEKNKQTALASVNALLANDVDGTLKDITNDGIELGDGTMTPVKGKDSIKAMLTTWRNSFSEYKADNLTALADGDYVAIIGDWSGTFKEDFMGMPTKGKSFRIRDCDIFKFNSEGKITEHKNVQTTAELMKQMGMK